MGRIQIKRKELKTLASLYQSVAQSEENRANRLEQVVEELTRQNKELSDLLKDALASGDEARESELAMMNLLKPALEATRWLLREGAGKVPGAEDTFRVVSDSHKFAVSVLADAKKATWIDRDATFIAR